MGGSDAFLKLYNYTFGAVFVAPEAAPVTLLSGGAVWTYGDYSADFIAAGAVGSTFVIRGVGFAAPDNNADYTIELTYGALDLVAARVGFNKASPFTSSIWRPVYTKILPAGSRVRARMEDSAGGSSCKCKIYYMEV